MDWKKIAAAGLVGGYVLTVIQTTDGPANLFKKARSVWRRRVHLGHLEALADCGWCAAPYVTLPLYAFISASLRGERGGGGNKVGAAVAVAVAAFLRHEADRY